MSKKIKVVHIVTLLELGGAQQTALTLLRRLPSEKFDVVLLCGRGGVLDTVAQEAGIRVRFVPGLIRMVRPWWDLLALMCLVRFLREESPDIVHTHSSKAGVLGRMAALLAGVPAVVHTVHGFGFTPAQFFLVRRLFIFLERRLARRTTALIFVSKANRTEALTKGIGRPDQMRLIRAAVPLQDYLKLSHGREAPPGLEVLPSDFLVTTVGPFKPQKNLSDFVRAAAWVAERHPSARFLVVGDGAGRAALEADIRQRGLASRFILSGWRWDMPAIMDRSDVFCMTSLWEGLPMALVEAMAAGLPVVVNAVDGCADVVVDGHNGFLISPGQPTETARRLGQLSDDPALRARLGQRARETIGMEFDARTMVQEHETLYSSLGRRPADPQKK